MASSEINRLQSRSWLAWRIVLTLLLMAGTVHAAPSWVEGINVLYEKPDNAGFQVLLANAFQMAAVESNAGKRCGVRLQPGFSLQSQQERFSAEKLLWDATATLPLESVTSEWVANQLWVQLYFQNTVSCTFQIGANRRTLLVTIRPEDSAATQAINQQLQQAKSALARGDTASAITLYRAILEQPPHPLQQDALEYLGVALERQQDYDRAAKIYQAYLNEYPDAAGVPRVRQRLEGIALMQEVPPPELRKAKTQAGKETTRWFGVLSNSYQHYSSDQGVGEWENLQSAWVTDVNLNGRHRGEEMDVKVLVSAGYWNDFNDETPEPERLSTAYADVYHKSTGQQVRAGRQTTNGEGMLGRYDGVRYSKSLGPQYAVNGIWGHPVISSRDIEINSDTQLYGLSLDITPPQSRWKHNLFVTEQTVNGMLDRQAVGGEVNFIDKNQSWLSYLDYDVNFNELNTVMLNANWFGADESHYYVALDYRRSPVLTLSNALIGQTLTELDQLAALGFTDSELEEVALDRSAISQSVSAGTSRRFHPHHRWAVDASLWQLSGLEESVGVPGFDGTDLETNLSVQLISNDILWQRDLSWFTLRYADLTTSQLYSVTAEIRVPIDSRWRVRPKLQIYERSFTEVDGAETSVQPLVRLEYQPDKAWNFELDAGAEWLSSDQNGFSVERLDYLLYLRGDWLF